MDSVIEQLAANLGIDERGCFLTPVNFKSILSNLKPSLCEADSSVPATDAQAESTENWNDASVLCGDGEFHLSSDSYFESSSLDGSVSGFWPLIWESLRITWALKMHHHFVNRPYRPVSRKAGLLHRKAKDPARPYVNTEGYPKNIALVLIKYKLKRWLRENPGFCILIGGPGARAPNVQVRKYYVRCFGEMRFRNSGRSCVVDAACNAGFLLLGKSRVLSMSIRFSEVAWRASQRCHLYDEGKA